MSDLKAVHSIDRDLVQAKDLLQLVDLEARWENLRNTPASTPGSLSLEELQEKQKAHLAFQAHLVAYNQRYTPAHIPELLLNTPARLGKWCWHMRDLCRKVEQAGTIQDCSYLAAKAYRWADKIARRLGKDPVPREPAAGGSKSIADVLEYVGQWCSDLNPAAVAG